MKNKFPFISILYRERKKEYNTRMGPNHLHLKAIILDMVIETNTRAKPPPNAPPTTPPQIVSVKQCIGTSEIEDSIYG